MKKVEEQKGPIKAHEDTYRTMPYSKKVEDRAHECSEHRRYQTMELHEPKTSKGR